MIDFTVFQCYNSIEKHFKEARSKMKKILSAAVALLCFFSVSVFSPSKSEAATAMTEASFQTSLEKFRNTVYGEGSTYKNNVKLYGGAQCFGYANQLAKYIYGSYPTGSMSGVGVSGGWQVSYGAEAVDALHVGDIVRFRYHSIFVTDIYNGYVFFTDANSDGANTVTWQGWMEVSYLKELVSEKLASGVCSADGIWHTGWVAHYKNWKNMPKSTVNFDGNGGVNSTMMYIEIVPRVVEDGAGFVAEQLFSYYDYRFSGYTVRRDNDNKWYVSGKGWLTQEEINAGGYSKKLYAPDEKVTVDASWKRGITGECSFTLVAQWRRGDGVVGDANGDGEVDLIDAMMIFYDVAKKESVAWYRRSRCDIDLDLRIDIKDAMKVFFFVAKKIPSLE